MNSRGSLASALALRFFENRYLLVLGLMIIILAGYSALSNMPRIEDPRITNRYPQIVTLLPGASAERVEALVSDRIEDSLRELSEIKEIRSTSRAGISVIAVELQDYIGPDENQQVFSSRRYQVVHINTVPMDQLITLPAKSGTTSFYHSDGVLKGHVKGSVKPLETLFMSLISLDLFVGTDKAYADSAETGNPFYTSLKPWRRNDSDMWYFANFLTYWGWRL